MNKGLEIRKAKLEKKAKKRYEVKADQVGVERKVGITYIELKRINGKYERFKRVREGIQKGVPSGKRGITTIRIFLMGPRVKDKNNYYYSYANPIREIHIL